MLNVSDAYKAAATSNVQESHIKVEVGRFGIRVTPSGDPVLDVIATYDEDDVQDCTISGSMGDNGQYSIGSLESFQCDLSIFTDSIKPVIENINNYDVRVSFGYTLADGTVEWTTRGVFATDKTLVTKEGMTTRLSMYDAAYWLDGMSIGPIYPEAGVAASLHSMVTTTCEEYGITLAADALTVLPNPSLTVYRPTNDDNTVRGALSQLAAAGFCNATMYDNELHFIAINDTGITLTPDDFQDIPTFDFCSTTVDQVTAEVTETYEYTVEETTKKTPTYSIVKDSNRKVAAFPGNKAKGDKFILYVRGTGTDIKDYDKATDAPWSTVKYTGSKSSAYYNKTLLNIYDAGKLRGVYIGSGVRGVGRNAFNLARYNDKVYFAGKNTQYFQDSYGDPSFRSSAKLYGASRGNLAKDWEAISEAKGEDETITLQYPEDRSEGTDHNVIEMDGDLFAGGTINSLMDEGALMDSAEQDFATIGACAKEFPFTYYGSSVSMFGRDYYTLGDKLNVTDVFGDTHPLYIFNVTYSFGGAVSSNYGCDGIESDVSAGKYSGNGSLRDIVDDIKKDNVNIKEKLEDALDKAEEVIWDANLAGTMADSAYDDVYPITSAMRNGLEQADEIAALNAKTVSDEMEYKYTSSSTLAEIRVDYRCKQTKNAVRWASTYTGDYEAWASDDEATQKLIADAKAKLDTANAALDEAYENEAIAEKDVADASAEFQQDVNDITLMLSKVNRAKGQIASLKKQITKLSGSKAKSAKKQLASLNKTLAELQTTVASAESELEANRAALALATYAVYGTSYQSALKNKVDSATYDYVVAKYSDSDWLASAKAQYGDGSKAALTVAQTRVDRAQEEVDVAVDGIKRLCSTTIEQTAQGIKLTADKVEKQDKKLSELEVTADNIKSSVSTLDEVTGELKKATNMTQTDEGWTWNIVDNTARTNASNAQSTASSAASTASSAASTASSAASTASNALSTANSAYSTASNAAKTATNYMNMSSDGLCIGNQTASTLTGNVLISSDGVTLRDNTTALARFTENGVTFADGTAFMSNGVGNLFYVGGDISITTRIKAGDNAVKLAIPLGKLKNTNEKDILNSNGYRPLSLVRLSTSKYGVVKLNGFDLNPTVTNDSDTALTVQFTRNGTGSTKTINSKSSSYDFIIYIQILWIRCTKDMLSTASGSWNIDGSLDDTDTGDDSGGTSSTSYVTGSFDSNTGKLTLTLT